MDLGGLGLGLGLRSGNTIEDRYIAILGGPVHFGLEEGKVGGLRSAQLYVHDTVLGQDETGQTYRSSRLITLGPFGSTITGLTRTGSSSITY